jgi:hypothetical protein
MRYWPDHARADERWLATNQPHGHKRKHARRPGRSTVRTIGKGARAFWRLLHRALGNEHTLANDAHPQPGRRGSGGPPRRDARHTGPRRPPLDVVRPDPVAAGPGSHPWRPAHLPVGDHLVAAIGRASRSRPREGEPGDVRVLHEAEWAPGWDGRRDSCGVPDAVCRGSGAIPVAPGIGPRSARSTRSSMSAKSWRGSKPGSARRSA